MSARDNQGDRRARRLRQEKTSEQSADVNHSNPTLTAQASELLARTRRAQGLPPTITDPSALRRVAQMVRPPSTGELSRRARQEVAA